MINSPGSQMSGAHNLDTQSVQVEFPSSGGEFSSSASSKIMENYLILDRLNKKQQRKQQQLKLKQLQHQQQLNELRQRQLELEAQLANHDLQNEPDSTSFNSKLTSHYIIPTTKPPSGSNTHAPPSTGVSNLRMVLQQQLSQHHSNRYTSPTNNGNLTTENSHANETPGSNQTDHPDTYQFVQVSGNVNFFDWPK